MKSGNSAAATWLSHSNLALSGLLVFTLVVRGSVLWGMRGNLSQDPDAYREIAENLLRHGEFALGKTGPDGGVSQPTPTAYRPPLYPVVLSNLATPDGRQVSLVKVAVLHLVLGMATVWLTWLTAARYLVNGVGPEGRQEVAPTVRSGLDDQAFRLARSGGPAHGSVRDGVGPSGLSENKPGATDTPTLRSGLLPIGPPGLWIAPLIAGLLVACDPILLNQQTLVMTETLAAFLAILSLWYLARFDQSRTWFNAALAGGAIGLAILCRPTFLPWLGLVGLAMLFVRGRTSEANRQKSVGRWLNDIGWRLANILSLGIIAAAAISPWVIRNSRVIGKPIATTTHGGYTLLLGNNDSFFAWLVNDKTRLPWTVGEEPGPSLYLRQIDAMDDMAKRTGEHPEIGFDRECYRSAFQHIAANPLVFVYACAYRTLQLWSPLPNKLVRDESLLRMLLRYAVCLWYCTIYMLAAIGIWRLRWQLLQPPWIWGVLLCLSFTAVHTFYWTNLRMRAPLMPFVAIVAAAAVSPRFRASKP